jgi:hypothetical protein
MVTGGRSATARRGNHQHCQETDHIAADHQAVSAMMTASGVYSAENAQPPDIRAPDDFITSMILA